MKPWNTRLLWMTFTVASLTGCGVPEQQPLLATVAQEVSREGDERPPPTGMNGTSPSCFWAPGTQQALRTLGGAALDTGAGELPAIPLSKVSESCRQVLRSAIQCALTPEQSVTDPVTGEHYTGWWGLAPGWLGNGLETQGRRYVTACMVQRLNYYGASVPILLEGRHSALAQSASYSQEYPLAESTVFGDLFSSTTPLLGVLPAFKVYVCWESLLPQSCGPLGLPLLEKRICDDAPLCGLMTLGPCGASCTEEGGYWKCRPGLLAPAWPETVRVKLEAASCQ